MTLRVAIELDIRVNPEIEQGTIKAINPLIKESWIAHDMDNYYLLILLVDSEKFEEADIIGTETLRELGLRGGSVSIGPY